MQEADLSPSSARARSAPPSAAPPEAAEALPEPSSYERHCRPRTGELLRRLRLDQAYHRALGDRLSYIDARGTERAVLDFLGGYGASLFGHNHPKLREELARLLEREVPFNAQMSCRAGAGELGRRLGSLLYAATGRDFVATFSSTGAEAVEAALKHAELVRSRGLDALDLELRRLRAKLEQERDVAFSPSFDEQAAERLGCSRKSTLGEVLAAVEAGVRALRAQGPVFLSLEGAFHGKTGAALQLTHNARYRGPFLGLGPEVRFVRFGAVDDLQRALDETRVDLVWPRLESGVMTLDTRSVQRAAAMFIEPIQGEGGIREVPTEFLVASREACSRQGVPLVFDEIQCGMGRSGDFLASAASGVVADYYLLSKSLGGGLSKISVLLVDRGQYDDEFGVIHSSTFAEDELSTRVAARALELLESDRLPERARSRGAELARGLAALEERFPLVVEDVTGRGLMLGLRLRSQLSSRSNTLRILSAQRILGYVVAGYLLHEHGIRLMPTLSDTHVLRIEPSAYVSDEACARLLASLEAMCIVLQRQNAYHLTRFLLSLEQPGEPVDVPCYGPPRIHRDAPPAPPGARAEVAFVGHLIDASGMVLSDPSLERFTPAQRERYLDRVWSVLGPAVFEEQEVVSSTRARVGLKFIGLCVDSRIIGRKLRERDLHDIRAQVERALELAEESGCAVLGLGGYTSVVSRNGTRLLPRSATLTTGNSLTVAMGLEALLEAAHARGIDLSRACFAAIGASGNIGSVYSQLMAEHVPHIVLVGRAHSEPRLRQVACSIYERALRDIRALGRGGSAPLTGIAARLERHPLGVEFAARDVLSADAACVMFDALSAELGSHAPVVLATDLGELRRADLIVAASNEPSPLIFPEHLAARPVVICDISVPMDTDASVRRERSDVTVIQGGVVQLADNPQFSIPGIPLELGTSFACMAETLLLGLAGIRTHYSHGPIEIERVKEIWRLAALHGFQLARPKTEASY